MTNKITFFPVGNGDSVLLEADGLTIMTDVNYRESCQEEADVYDFASELQEACKKDDGFELDIFVSTHPDADHTRNFEELFHTGGPEKYNRQSSNPLILVKEIWCSPYAINPNYETEESKPLIQEIKRRDKLSSSAEGQKDGNRLRILSLDGKNGDNVSRNVYWELLAPTKEEANIPSGDGSNQPSCNNSSLVIRWTIDHGNHKSHVLLGGDAEVEVWERIWENNLDTEWHILLAPHHCSRGSMARKNEDDKYDYSEKALDVLGRVANDSDGFIVSSSKKIERNDDNPPSWEAKKKYIEILAKSSREPGKRFLNPDTNGNNSKPEPVIFEFDDSKGMFRKTIIAPVSLTSSSAAAVHHRYG